MRNSTRIFIWLVVLVLFGALIWTLARYARPDGVWVDPLLNLVPQPTPTIYPSAATVVERVQALSRLETASYHVEKVITAESGQGPLGFLFGDKLLLIAYGQVIAGVDLGFIGPDDVLINDDGVMYLHLPPAEIFVATLDNQRTRVYDRRTGMAGMNEQLETAARQEAERLILQAALEDGVLDKADTNARDFLRSMFLGMGFKQLIFVEVIPTATPAPTLTLSPEITLTVSP